MDHGDKKMKRKPAMAGMYGRKQKVGGGKMYAQGGKAHSGAQPVYGNTVETSMPKAGAN